MVGAIIIESRYWDGCYFGLSSNTGRHFHLRLPAHHFVTKALEVAASRREWFKARALQLLEEKVAFSLIEGREAKIVVSILEELGQTPLNWVVGGESNHLMDLAELLHEGSRCQAVADLPAGGMVHFAKRIH